MSIQSREDLIANLHSKTFRDAFVSSRVSNTLALQIRAMRQDRGWSQAYLAELLGTSQNTVYRLESPQYGRPSITTLKRLASIFDVGLAVWFTTFSTLVDRVINIETEDILVPSFSDTNNHVRSDIAGRLFEVDAPNEKSAFRLADLISIRTFDKGRWFVEVWLRPAIIVQWWFETREDREALYRSILEEWTAYIERQERDPCS